jgi:hypothetical protein
MLPPLGSHEEFNNESRRQRPASAATARMVSSADVNPGATDLHPPLTAQAGFEIIEDNALKGDLCLETCMFAIWTTS